MDRKKFVFVRYSELNLTKLRILKKLDKSVNYLNPYKKILSVFFVKFLSVFSFYSLELWLSGLKTTNHDFPWQSLGLET